MLIFGILSTIIGMILFVHARKRIFIRENQMGLSASTMDAMLEFLAKCLTFFGMTLTFIYGGMAFVTQLPTLLQ